MDKDNWDQLNILYLSEKHSLTEQKKEILKAEFSKEELRIRDAYIKQMHTAENSPAYGTKESKDKAMTASEVSYNHANSLISAKIEQRDYQIQQTIDECLDRIYEHDGGTRKDAESAHKNWLEKQAETRTEIDDPNKDSRQLSQDERTVDVSQNITTQFNDSRQLSQDERTVDVSQNITTQFNDPKPSIKEEFNSKGDIDNEIEMDI